MEIKVGIHQPNYIPWIGYFGKMKHADIFVLLDTVDYTKNSVINRNKIKTQNGWQFLTIPIEKKYYRKPIKEVLLPQDKKWTKKHWKSIETNYSKSPYFNILKDALLHMYEKTPDDLSEFNEKLILYAREILKLDTKIIKSSQLNLPVNIKKTDLLIEIVKKVQGTTYVSGLGAKTYLEENKFTDIKLEYYEYKTKKYKQINEEWMPNLSILDLLFSQGENSLNYI